MCGISGFIGESKNLEASFAILSKLFEKSEIRGTDAAGYWMTESGEDGRIFYHKQPGASSELVKSEKWKSVCKNNVNLALVHARGASRGYGDPLQNMNNHPFVNDKKNIALVHNGKMDDNEYNFLSSKYTVKTECDSEILLRIFEYAKLRYGKEDLKKYIGDLPYPHRMAGIKDIFSIINNGHMAVAIGEYDRKNVRCLWLFRNLYRPLWAIDLRDSLGQIFFISDPNIWHDAISEINQFKYFAYNSKICPVPDSEMWFLKIDEKQKHASLPIKYEIVKSEPKAWNGNDIYNNLHDDDDIEVDVVTTMQDQKIDNIICPDDMVKCDKIIDSIEKEIKKIQELSRSICVTSQVLIRNNTLSLSEAEQILSLLEEQSKSMKSIDDILS